jgi:hypothetical protein
MFKEFWGLGHLVPRFLRPQRFGCGPGEVAIRILWGEGYLESQGLTGPLRVLGYSAGCQQNPNGGVNNNKKKEQIFKKENLSKKLKKEPHIHKERKNKNKKNGGVSRVLKTRGELGAQWEPTCLVLRVQGRVAGPQGAQWVPRDLGGCPWWSWWNAQRSLKRDLCCLGRLSGS